MHVNMRSLRILLQVSALACCCSGFTSDTSAYLGGLSSLSSSSAAMSSSSRTKTTAASRSRSAALSMYREGPMDNLGPLPKFEDLYRPRRPQRVEVRSSAPGRPLRDPRYPHEHEEEEDEYGDEYGDRRRRSSRTFRFGRDRDDGHDRRGSGRNRSSRSHPTSSRRRTTRRPRQPSSRNPFARFQARFQRGNAIIDEREAEELEPHVAAFASSSSRRRRPNGNDPVVELLDRDDRPEREPQQVVNNLRDANEGTNKNRRRSRRQDPIPTATSTVADDTDAEEDASTATPPKGEAAAKRKRPLIYDRDLSHLADAFADRMLHHDQTFDDDGIRDILVASGIDAVGRVGSAWGYTSLHDGDALEAFVARKHPEISEDGALTHYALGFSKAAEDDAARNDDDDDEDADDEERNMYMFLAVSYEERHLSHHTTAVPPAFEAHSPEEHTDLAFAVLGMVNQMRMSAGLAPLSLDNKALQRAAQWYSNDMLIHGYPTQRDGGVPHVGTDGSTAEDRAEREGYHPLAVRENILSRFDMSAQGAFEQWWDSPGHRGNMMADDVTHMSLAVTCDVETGQYYYTQLFGRPFVQVPPDDLIRPLVSRLQQSSLEVPNRLPYRPNEVLMDYAAILAPYVSQHGELPSNTWDNIESRYAYDEITAVVAWTPYDDPDETMRYLAKTYEEQLNNPAYTEIGVGVHCDMVSQVLLEAWK